MTEVHQVNEPCRRALAPYGRWARVENGLPPGGHPDVTYCLLGVAGQAELKLGEKAGRRPRALTLEQVIWGEEWSRAPARGLWFLILRVGPAWRLYDAFGARALYEEAADAPLIHVTGRFPTREFLFHLAPPTRRPPLDVI